MRDSLMAQYARRAYEDLLRNYWIGDNKTGHIIPTWTGIPVEEVPDGDLRGGLWERGSMIIVMDNLYRATGDEDIRKRIVLEANRLKALFNVEELTAAGTHLHWACDDCGWHARLYLLFYQYVKDPWYVDCAKLMIDNAVDRWMDNRMGGSMWYRNDKCFKSLYQIAVVLACLDIYEITGEKRYFLIAMECYYWMEMNLKWKAGIYWTDLHVSGLPGQVMPAMEEYKEDPKFVGDPGSLSFLGGNMAMGAIHARLYRISGLKVYRERLDELCCGLLNIYVRDGCFINDRDAWTDTYCLGEWTREVAILPGLDPRLNKALVDTALSVAENARTEDGHYSAVWRGPAEDPNHRWIRVGSVARQIMTTSTSINWIVCALQLEGSQGAAGNTNT